MDEAKREKIKQEAKEILDNFAKKLESVKLEEKRFSGKLGGFREEGNGRKHDAEFRKIMFANAPQKDDDCIIAEKKIW